MKTKIIYGSAPYYLASLGLHLIGITLLFMAAAKHPSFWGLGLLAYSLGLRHAFDADHIAAIDNTVRKLIQQDKKSYGVGFYFSLGHSTVVFLMAILVSISVKWAKLKLPFLEIVGGRIGSLVSGSFLIAIAAFNFLVLISLYRSLKSMKDGSVDEDILNNILMSRGFLARILKPFFKCINRSWQMYPVGFLFGLGFDTATEIALIALSASTAQSGIPTLGIIALPVLFAAGMNLMDTTDSVMMSGAYTWAFDTPVRKAYYNLTVTTISVIAAFLIGAIELIQVATSMAHAQGGIWTWIQNIDFGWLGYGLVLMFLAMWLIAYGIWRLFIKKRETTL
ncbi:HoxN/HupN/NixA family nickel/cobalt transporter [Liquorilactobacillus hordei]|uniref:HoxN/HupN/NixA family nickel/cobalt transporter n=1 Tax=Liquorilactobacillus hordei TaxID=468911 RepID=UPI00070B6208|nr:HoxN/HupN/NixA family nickel/cobalt transporter [Liquorilactobacillus hordei]QYH52379.1 HoxN/HupN/NixA family nickel/cobalt transporter [Liquorilactobacillus hordei DSM 19519]